MVDRNRCIQHISERRGTVPLAIREVWANRLYGCTACQDVCPHNAHLSPTSREVIFGHVGDWVPLVEVLEMDEPAFGIRFRDNQIGMREPDAIRRNAVIAAGNSGQASLIPVLERLGAHSDPMIRRHSLWALARLDRGEAGRILKKAVEAEPDPGVADEIKSLLDEPDGFA
jgi:epoxyqueuosine reductase